jgi:hypothetical protein
VSGAAVSFSIRLASFQAEADLHGHLRVGDLALLDVAAHLGDLENQSRLRRVSDAFATASRMASSTPVDDDPVISTDM